MSLLPLNSTLLERVLEAARDHDLDPDIIRGVADSARCPANFLPWLGWALKVEGWEAAYTDDQRRELISEAIPVHRTKGTVGAIRRVLKAVRVNADFKEWHQIPNAAPYTFQVTAWANENRPGEGSIISPQLEQRLRTLVDAAKNERSHYTFRLGARFDGGLTMANASQAWLLHRRSVEAQAVPLDPSAQTLQFVNAAQGRTLHRSTLEVEPIPIPQSAQTLQWASVTQARAVSRGYVEALGVPIHVEANVQVANAARARIVVRGTMEAVL
ncbi:phage tail protein I [Pseudomonas sp. S36]|uniref:phage tail protein I n=1 Tax=Pseudomonas sp. S36 TaxID=2767447 RepID=UPI001913F46C|nr:phage tail protein I [Pseudomonas sp. S36]MBK4990214.1 phage tail protein I [Pseudomonas sp. S36]